MKSRFVGIALLSGFVLASPDLTFAGGQPARVYTPARNAMRDARDSGRPADERATGARAPRSEKGAAETTRAAHNGAADSAFHK